MSEKIAGNELKKTKQKKNSQLRSVIKRLFKNKGAAAGLIVFIVLILLAILSPLIIPYDYTLMDISNAYSGPSFKHWFGTDELGRDIFSRILYGSRFSLQIGVYSVVASTVVGVIIGSITGYIGGRADNIIMRFMDVIQAIPGMLLSIAVAAVLGTGFDKTIIALAIGNIPNYVRILRGSILSVRKMEYLEAATSIDCSTFRIIRIHILPNSLSAVIVQATMGVANSILAAAGLSFIGLGIQPPNPEWGAMLSAGRSFIRDYPHMVIFPGIFIMISVLALNMLGDGLRDALDPKLKN